MRSIPWAILWLLFSSLCGADQSPIFVRESKFYREIMLKDQKLILNKKTLSIFSKKENAVFKINTFQKSKLYSFNKLIGNKSYYIYFKKNFTGKNMIGSIVRNANTFYMANICSSDGTFSKVISQLTSNDINEKINAMHVESLFDKETCKNVNKEQFEYFKSNLENVLIKKKGDLADCLQSDSAQKIFAKDLALIQNVDEVFGRYMSLVDDISANDTKLKIKCGMAKEDTNKVASFSENPMVIALNLTDKKFSLGLNNTEDVIDHELLHLGSQQFKTNKDARCLDENFVKLFEKSCAYDAKKGMKLPPTSSMIVEACLDGKAENIDWDNGIYESKYKGEWLPISLLTTEASIITVENKSENIAITSALVSNPQVFVPVSETDQQALATNKISTVSGQKIESVQGDGQFHQVVADSSFTDSVNKVASNIGSSFNNVDGVLAKTLGSTGLVAASAAIGQRAIASTVTVSANNTTNTASSSAAPMTSTEMFLTRYLPDSAEVNKVIEDPKVANLSYEDKEKYYQGLNRAPVAGAASVVKVDKVSSIGANSESVSGAAASTSSPIIKSAANPVRGIASVPDEVPATANEPKEKRAELTGAISPAPSNSKVSDPAIQRLVSFSTVNEPEYSNVRRQYTNSNFRQQLESRKILILNEQGKPFWKTSFQPEKCFRDNGKTKVLERVPCG